MTTPTHYDVLSLPQSLLDDSKDDQVPIIVKQAYHRALLRHHPDKKSTFTISSSHASSPPPAYTVDQITSAHTTLSQAGLRREYNAHLATATTNNSTLSTPSAFQTGIETVDLDDLATFLAPASPTTTITTWYKPCRCGNKHGFVFGEADLEEASELGELIVGCQDCSLWLRVCFAVIDDDDDDDGGGGGDGESAGSGGLVEEADVNRPQGVAEGVKGTGRGAQPALEQASVPAEKQSPG